MSSVVPDIFDTGIYKAVEKAGSVVALAKRINVSRQAVYFWLKQGYAPMLRAIQIEEALGVPRADLMDPVLMRGSLAEATRVARPAMPLRAPTADDLV